MANQSLPKKRKSNKICSISGCDRPQSARLMCRRHYDHHKDKGSFIPNQRGDVPCKNRRAYSSWPAMLQRCYNPNNHAYSRYGGRGITVCERWRKSFKNFYADMGERPLNHTLDRINNDGNYEPDNCRWATWKEQMRNRRRSRYITAMGLTLPIGEWAEKTGLSLGKIASRLKLGWSVERALEMTK